MGKFGLKNTQKGLEDALVKVVGDKIDLKLANFNRELDSALNIKVERIVDRILKEKGIIK